jgi:hypothetical protein
MTSPRRRRSPPSSPPAADQVDSALNVPPSSQSLNAHRKLSDEWKSSERPYTADSLPHDWRMQAKSYTVYVANRSDWQIIGVKIGDMSYRLPEPIGKTCDDTCEECLRNQNVKPLYRIECTADPFDLYVYLQNGTDYYVTHNPVRVSPNCQEDGMSFCVENP